MLHLSCTHISKDVIKRFFSPIWKTSNNKSIINDSPWNKFNYAGNQTTCMHCDWIFQGNNKLISNILFHQKLCIKHRRGINWPVPFEINVSTSFLNLQAIKSCNMSRVWLYEKDHCILWNWDQVCTLFSILRRM